MTEKTQQNHKIVGPPCKGKKRFEQVFSCYSIYPHGNNLLVEQRIMYKNTHYS